jgi:hypothetical protein
MKKRLLILICCCLIMLSCGPASTTKNIAVIGKKNSIQEPKLKISDKKLVIASKLDTKKIIFSSKVIYETSDASKNNKNGYFINFKYPNMQGLVNQEIQNNINKDIKTKVETLTKNYQKDNQVVSNEFFTAITYNVLSIKFIISLDKPTWPPRNKPIYKIMTINYDLNSGREIQLENLFKPSSNYLQIISDAVLADLKEQSRNSSDLINITEADIKEITAPKIENYRNFLFNPKGITIFFVNDKVLYHKANYPKVLILYGKIESLFAPSTMLCRLG